MDISIIEIVVAFLGTAFVSVLAMHLRGLRSDMRDMRTDIQSDVRDMRTDIGGMRSDIGVIMQSLARVEATQAEHGKQLERMAGHGERIAALEGAIGTGS